MRDWPLSAGEVEREALQNPELVGADVAEHGAVIWDESALELLHRLAEDCNE